MFLQVQIVIIGNDYAPVITNETTVFVTINESFLSSSSSSIGRVVAEDEDSGINAEISYKMIETIIRLERTETLLTIAATDGGDPSLSTNVTIVIAFFVPCLVQKYTIEALTGIISGLFLCGVEIQPLRQQVLTSSAFSFTCTVVGNVPGAMVSLLHNSTLTVDEMVLPAQENNATFEKLNSAFVDAGQYQCRINTSIGAVTSNISTLSIAAIGKHVMHSCSVKLLVSLCSNDTISCHYESVICSFFFYSQFAKFSAPSGYRFWCCNRNHPSHQCCNTHISHLVQEVLYVLQ